MQLIKNNVGRKQSDQTYLKQDQTRNKDNTKKNYRRR
jgi:hypothetical protein